MFTPRFTISPAIAKKLLAIQRDRDAIAPLPIDIGALAGLRETARVAATHYSTQIEGNRLTRQEVKDVLRGAKLPEKRRDSTEVLHYYRALERVEQLAARSEPLAEQTIQRIHGLVLNGKDRPTPYRDGQNVIRDSRSGAIVYMPPEAADVPALMAELVAWIASQLGGDLLPAPLVAGLAHYQFATIHPYYDGNGRTARLLTTLALHRMGYGLKGLYSLEEYYAQNLDGYYAALTVGKSHNYYEGRRNADVTGFLAYFCAGMAASFSAVRKKATEAASAGAQDLLAALRELPPRERLLLQLFARRRIASTAEIAEHLKLAQRTVLGLCRDWVKDGFLVMRNPSKKSRAYALAERYERLI